MFSTISKLTKCTRSLCAAALALTACAALAPAQTGTGFTYQGSLMDGGVPANGSYDIFLTPYAAATGSQTLGPSFCADNVPVVNGLFAVQVPLRMPPSGQLYLGLQFRQDVGTDCASSAGLIELSPRQEVTPAPQAVYANAVRQDSSRIRGALRLQENGSFDIYDGSRWRRIATLENLPAILAGSQFFDTAGTSSFVVPPDVTEIYVAAWGGSGAGGPLGPGLTFPGVNCSSSPDFASGGGGGAPGAGIGVRLTVTPGETLTIVVGSGGITRGNQAGGSGGTTFIRRGSTDVVIAPGGGGGQRAAAAVGMPSPVASSCGGAIGTFAADPGVPAAAPQLLGVGSIISTASVSFPALRGSGPSCWNSFSGNPPQFESGTCPARGGAGGRTASNVLGADLPSQAPSGGGDGAAPSTPASPGSSGRVRIYWY
jgi:hypothetical protein